MLLVGLLGDTRLLSNMIVGSEVLTKTARNSRPVRVNDMHYYYTVLSNDFASSPSNLEYHMLVAC